MRLIILTHYYAPEPGAPQARLAALAQGLAARGVEVTVHTGPPHYPDGRVPPPYRNDRPWRREVLSGVPVVRSAVAPAANRGTFRRLADHASFALSSTLTATATGPADVVLVESPPLFLAGSALAYARLKRAPLVLNIADLWPDSVVDLGALDSRWMIEGARRLERAAYRGAAAIATPTAGIADVLGSRPESAGKVCRIAPSVDREVFAAPPPTRADGPLRVLYAGTVGLAQGLDTLVRAAALAGPHTVQVTIAGGGAEEPAVRELVERELVANVRLLGPVPSNAVPGLYRETDAAVVLLRDRPVFHGALPTKMYEAMASGRPLLLSAAGESADLISRCGAGRVVAPEDPHALAEALKELAAAPPDHLRELGDAGRAEAARHDRGPWLDRWESLLRGVSGGAAVTRYGADSRAG